LPLSIRMGYDMAITTLLTIHSIDEPADTINPTLAIASELGAHINVIVLGVIKTTTTSAYPGLPDYYLADEYNRVIKDVEARAKEVEELASKSGVSIAAHAECVDRAMIGRAAARHAFFADMTLFPNRNIPSNMAMTEAFNGVLFETGRPALVLGAKSPAIAKPRCVLMAWNGEPQAAKAIHQSLMLLDGSQDVRLVLVDPEATPSGINPGDEMAAFLARHRQKVTVDTIASAGREVADVLLQHAFDKDVDLIVMGGYGRSRLREWLLGGTTRNLLTKSELPVFMVH